MVNAHKKPVNLSLDGDLVERARALDLKLSGIAEAAIRDAVATEAARRWKLENKEAIEAYNKRIGDEGLLSDHVPGWWNDDDAAV